MYYYYYIRLLGCDVLFLPAAFHEATGPTHWELLSRARACDNQFYVAAINPARNPTATYVTWGHSMIVDPQGQIVVQGGTNEEIISAKIGKCHTKRNETIANHTPNITHNISDLNRIEECRREFPLFESRRTDVYDIVYNNQKAAPHPFRRPSIYMH